MKKTNLICGIAAHDEQPYFVMCSYKTIFRHRISIGMPEDKTRELADVTLSALAMGYHRRDIICYQMHNELFFAVLKNPMILVMQKCFLEPFLRFRHKYRTAALRKVYARVIAVVVGLVSVAMVYACGSFVFGAL